MKKKKVVMKLGGVINIPKSHFLVLKELERSGEFQPYIIWGYFIYLTRPVGDPVEVVSKVASSTGLGFRTVEDMFVKARKIERRLAEVRDCGKDIYIPKEVVKVFTNARIRSSYFRILFFILATARVELGFITNIHVVDSADEIGLQPSTIRIFLEKLRKIGVVYRMRTNPYEGRVLGARHVLTYWVSTDWWDNTWKARDAYDELMTRAYSNTLCDTKVRKLSFKARLKRTINEKSV